MIIFRYLMLVSLFTVLVNAATITTAKETFVSGEKIEVTVTAMQGQNQDWVGIYPVNANNDWENVVSWAWTGDTIDATFKLGAVPVGEYEVRAFYNNSFVTEATTSFTVIAQVGNTQVATNKNSYNVGETVVVNFSDMQGQNQDWIGIYPVNANNDWGNVVAWSWTGDTKEGSVELNGIPVGEYEVRVFFNNSFETEASSIFTVVGQVLNTQVSTSKPSYEVGETIVVNFSEMKGENHDWVGIYPVNANNDWENVAAWSWTGDTKEGSVELNAAIPAGEYEVRAFFNNSFSLRAKAAFTIVPGFIPPTVYEDAEDRTTLGWTSVGPKKVTNVRGGNNSNRAIYARVVWEGFNLKSSYTLRMENRGNWHNKTQTILKVDQKTNGTACFLYGVVLETTLGKRYMYFNVWFARNGWGPVRAVYADGSAKLTYPLAERYRKRHGWETITQNLTEKLHILEPENNIISVSAFSCSGGDWYDNIRLESR